jgi:hypothetical protein
MAVDSQFGVTAAPGNFGILEQQTHSTQALEIPLWETAAPASRFPDRLPFFSEVQKKSVSARNDRLKKQNDASRLMKPHTPQRPGLTVYGANDPKRTSWNNEVSSVF